MSIGRDLRLLRRRDRWRWARWTCLAVGILLVFAGLALPALHQAARAHAEQQGARLSITAPTPREPATLLVKVSLTVVDHRTTQAVQIVPTVSSAVPPPGVARFPGPGEVFVSPAVAALPDGGRSFGSVVGQIGPEGLVGGNELRVYYRPPAEGLNRGQLIPAAGFGGAGDPVAEPAVALLEQIRSTDVWVLAVGTLLAPGMVLMAAGSSMGLRSATRHLRRLAAMGASPVQLATVRLLEAAPGLLAGLLLSLVLAGGLLMRGFQMPWAQANYFPSEFSGRAPQLLWLMCVALIVGGVVMAFPGAVAHVRRRSTRDVQVAQALPIARATAFVVAVLAAWVLPNQVSGEAPKFLLYLVAVLFAGFTASAFVAVICSLLGNGVVRLGRLAGRPGAITAGRALAAHPLRLSRLLLPICVVILFTGQGQLWTTLLGDQVYQAIDAQRAVRGTVAVSDPLSQSISPEQLDRLRRTGPNQATPNGVVWLTTQSAGSDTSTTWQATCPDLRRLGLDCVDGPTTPRASTPALVGLLNSSYGSAAIKVSPSAAVPKEGTEVRLAVVSSGRVDLTSLNQRALGVPPGDVRFTEVGENWRAGAEPKVLRGKWVVTFGAMAVAAAVLAAGVLLVVDLTGQARLLAGLAALTSRRRWLITHGVLALAAPVVLAGAVATITYLVMPETISRFDVRMEPSRGLAAVMFALTAVAGVLAAAAAVRSSVVAADAWQPGREVEDD